MLQIKFSKKSFSGLALMLALLLLLSALVPGQSVSANLSGVVKDESGAVVPGANVTVTDNGTKFQRGVATNDNGYYTIPQLPPGIYSVQVTRTGFSTLNVTNLVLNANDRRSLDLTLKVGEVGATVTVEGGEVGVVKESPEVSTVVDRQFVENLPLNGRSFQSLIALTPGVVRTGTEGQFSVNGQRDNANYFTVDGVSGNIGVGTNRLSLGQSGAGQVAGFNAVGGTSGLISVDAMQEFRIQTSTYSAEFGRTPGGQIQIVSRAGKDKFEGSVFEYFRNDALDANNWFNNANNLKKAPLRQNDFGGVLGGPVYLPNFGEGGPVFKKAKNTFFFFSYEGLRLRLPVTATNVFVPSLEARNSAPAAVRPYILAMPLPNGGDTGFGSSFFNASFSNPTNLDATSLRIDHYFSSKVTLFGRFNYSPSVSTVRQPSTPTTLTDTKKNIQTWTLGSTQTLTSALVNELRANYSKNSGSYIFRNDDFGGAIPAPDELLFPSFADPATSSVDINAALQGVAFSRGSDVDNTQEQINVVDNLTWIAGNHSLKFGADYRYLFPTAQPRIYSLGLNFFSLDALLNASPNLVIVTANDRVRVQLHNFSLYGQDTWRVSKRLTLDLGLRWEYNPPPTGRGGDILYTVDRVDDPANVLLAPAGTPLYPTVWNAFAPRFGASYQVWDNQNWGATVLRGGFGVFYDLGSASALATTGAFPHQRANVSFSPVGFPLPLAASVVAPPTLANLNPPFTNQTLLGFDQNYTLPRTYQWNVALEQGLGKNQTLSVTYVGAAARELLRQERQLPPASQPGRFLNMLVYRNSDSSDYNALQVQFTRRLTNGFQLLSNYTYGKATDTNSTDSPPSFNPGAGANQLNVENERGRSDFDVRHNFNLTASYDIPSPSDSRFVRAILGGWATDAIFNARTGTPINVTVSRTIGFGTGFAARPDLVPGVDIWIDDPNVAGGRRLNRAAFSVPAEPRQGNLERNSITGFSFWQLDFALRRQFNLTERVKFQVKGELFNAFNHPNFTNPSGNLGSLTTSGRFQPNANFGKSLSMLATGLSASGFSSLYQPGGPRSVQLTMKIIF